MSDLQLGLFGEDTDLRPLPEILVTTQCQAETRGVVGDPVTETVSDPPGQGAASLAVEPYIFSLVDPQGRWTITAGHVDEVKRGKATRRMVGRCSCGWVSEFNLHPCGRTGPDLLLGHLRSHQLESQPPQWLVDAQHEGWIQVRLLAGRVHCAAVACHRLGPLPGQRRPASGQEHRLSMGFGEPCQLHGAALYDRPYHWAEHDPEDHHGEPQKSYAVGLLDPAGAFWHYWCAPFEVRHLFGFLRKEERTASAYEVVSGAVPHVS